MKKLTPYLINRKALQLVMAALLLLGGSGLAWGQAGTATVVWDASHDQSGQNLGLDNNLILEIDGTRFR